MCSIDKDFFWWEDVEDTKARILVAQFNGAFDVGGAARLVVEETLRSLPTECVVTFDMDAFLDYRSHRSLATVSDRVLESVEMLKFVLDRVKDDLGNPVLVPHGVEPDAKQESLSRIVIELAIQVGVEVIVSFDGMPSGVPYTRPTPVHTQVMEEALIPKQPQTAATLRFSMPMTTFLQERLANQGTPGIVLLAVILFYVADAAYSAGASVLLSALSDLADLPLPVGELEQDAAEEHTAIKQILESNSEMQRTVVALEEYFDVLNGAGRDGVPPGEWAERTPLRSERETEKDIGDVTEAYLTNLVERPEKDEAEEAQTEEESDPL